MTPSSLRPRRARRIAVLVTVLAALAWLPAAAAAAARPPADAARAMDALLSSAFRPDEPGATVVVVRDGQTLLREAMLVADHNSYHLGQLMQLKKTLEARGCT